MSKNKQTSIWLDVSVFLACVVGVLVVLLLTGCSSIYTQKEGECMRYAKAKCIEIKTGERVDPMTLPNHMAGWKIGVGTSWLKETQLPVVASIPMFSQSPFEQYGIYRRKGRMIGSHAMVCIDYKYGTFEFINSWGGMWGRGGHCYIREKDIPDVIFWWKDNDKLSGEKEKQ